MKTEKTTIQLGHHKGGSIRQVKISVDANIAASFKKACAAASVSMASTLSEFMAEYADTAFEKRMPSPIYATRRQRRTAVRRFARQLKQIRECEETYRDRIPENLQGSAAYDSAEEFVSLLDEAIDALDFVAST